MDNHIVGDQRGPARAPEKNKMIDGWQSTTADTAHDSIAAHHRYLLALAEYAEDDLRVIEAWQAYVDAVDAEMARRAA